jgi:hypothetical protein
MLQSNIRPEETREELVRLAERHSRRGVDIPPAMYDQWLDALCEAVRDNDPNYTPDLEVLWRRAMKNGIELFQSMYE